jgi:antagonist of KipI
MKLCRVVKPGLLTTVQDLGRPGFQRYGVPTSGAMDTFAFAAANLLVGTQPDAASLEITLLGPELEFLTEAQIGITGADLAPTINGEGAGCWQTLQVLKGDTLAFGHPRSGCRAYLAVRGGIDVPTVLGSRSTYLRGRFGGFQGRQLKAGDIVEAYKPTKLLEQNLSIPPELVPSYNDELTVGVVLGPQSDHFVTEEIEVFLSNAYTVTIDSDRMGYRLAGSKVRQGVPKGMVSDAITAGSVQIPPSGQPIVMMRDSQTTGGYPKIAVVTTPDVSRLGQLRPNHCVKFSKTSMSEARTSLLEYHRSLSQLRGKLKESPTS